MMTKAAAKAPLAEGLSKALYGDKPVNHTIRNSALGLLIGSLPGAAIAGGLAALASRRNK